MIFGRGKMGIKIDFKKSKMVEEMDEKGLDTRYYSNGQKGYKFKKVGIFQAWCTCGNQIGRYQRKYMKMIEKYLVEYPDMPLNVIQLKAQRDLGFIRDCCANLIQNYICAYITNENGYASQTVYGENEFGTSTSQPIRHDGPSVSLQKAAPQYPQLNGNKILSPKLKSKRI